VRENPDISILMDRIRVETSWTKCRVLVYPNTDELLKRNLYSSADIFVSPANSLQETFGLSIVEAMLYQLPVLATKWSGYQDILDEGLNGFMINTKVALDTQAAAFSAIASSQGRAIETVRAVKIDWHEFAEKMDILYQRDDLRCKFGLAGAAKARGLFSSEAMIGSYEQLWLSALEARRSNPVDLRCFGPSVEALLEAASMDLH
jgi:glycosyltransferase involved in cell wall biosynthesis